MYAVIRLIIDTTIGWRREGLTTFSLPLLYRHIVTIAYQIKYAVFV